MATQTEPASEPRIPLNRDRVLRAAIEVADEEGLEALTMRNLAQHLGVEAMSIYYHVANKETLLDGVVDVLVEEIEEAVSNLDGSDGSSGWKSAMRERILKAREVMLRHPWAPDLVETRTTMSPSIIRYHDGLLGILRAGDFSWDLAHHALHALGSRSLGFTQELFKPESDADEEEAEEMLAAMADQFPNIIEMLGEIVAHGDPDSTLGWCDDQTEFEFGLDILLDGLDRLNST
ncbi:MAG: TetR/AcrR family transcriptional regulator C-terminal domain-containing protein, partial [Acidimicrobiia bacterium]